MRLLLPLLLALALPLHAQKAARQKPGSVKLTGVKAATRDIVYKTTPQGELLLHVFSPAGEVRLTALRPCIVFFFGGGWKSGSYHQFVPHAEYLASRGMTAISADYRISSIHKTTPDKAVEDAKSAIRWVRGHSTELSIDPGKIIAGGGSAGGHLAACTALVSAFDAESDDKSISSKPNALVLFNPAMNIATLFKEREGGGSPITSEVAEAITPNNFVRKDSPPAILFFGTNDKLKTGGDEYVKKARELGLRAEMWTAPKLAHGLLIQRLGWGASRTQFPRVRPGETHNELESHFMVGDSLVT